MDTFQFKPFSTTDMEKESAVTTVDDLGFVPAKNRKAQHKKRNRRHSKRGKSKRGKKEGQKYAKLQRSLKKLEAMEQEMSKRINRLKNYDKNGFFTLRQRGNLNG